MPENFVDPKYEMTLEGQLTPEGECHMYKAFFSKWSCMFDQRGRVSGPNKQNMGYWACWDPIWVVWDPYSAKKWHFRTKRAFLGPLAARKRLDTRPKCKVTMSPTHANQSGPVGGNLEAVFRLKSFLGPAVLILVFITHYLGVQLAWTSSWISINKEELSFQFLIISLKWKRKC